MTTSGRSYVESGPRRLRLPALSGGPTLYWLFAAFALAFGLRLVFSLAESRVQLVWDAAAYWGETQTIRASACSAFAYCDPGGTAAGGATHAVDTVFFSKNGLLPLVEGLALTVLPNTVTTALIGFAILDALVCVMIAVIVLRLGGPLWVAVLAAVLAAVYVPGIVGDGTFLQQPLIRFALAATACSYACAFTTERNRRAFVIAGTCSLVLLGFSSQPTRPLLWIVPAAVIAIAASGPSTRPIAWMQLRASAATAGGLVVLAVLIALLFPEHSLIASLTNLGLVLSTEGTAEGQVTVLSFPHFWPTDAWPFFRDSNATGSVFGDLLEAPVEFARLLAFSIYANWRHPDLLFFQEFGLGSNGQQVQHLALVTLGFAGLAWLLGQPGPRRLVGATVLVTTGLISLLAGLVSVEPRRVGSLVPMLALGAGCFAWSLARRRTWGRFELAGAAGLTVCAASWLVSLPALLAVLPLSPDEGQVLLVAARTAATAAVGAWLLIEWRRRWERFSIALPAVFGALLLFLVMTSQLPGAEWRPWTATIQEPIRQQVDGLRTDPGMYSWLVADFGSPAEATAAAIYVDGRLVKAAGVPMRRWQVSGEMLGWAPYADLRRMGVEDEPRTWMAAPLEAGTLGAGRASIVVRPPDGGLTIAGDYGDGDRYTGPALDPFFSGFSLWRWIWNGEDPRIPFGQDLAAGYASAMSEGGDWRSDDLSPGFGRATGRYRLYLSQQPFGPRTNILQASSGGAPPGATGPCRRGEPYATTAGAGSPWLCQEPDGDLAYYSAGGIRLGASPETTLKGYEPRGTIVDRRSSRGGSVELVSGGGPLFVANVYTPRGKLAYSLGFAYPAVLPTYT